MSLKSNEPNMASQILRIRKEGHKNGRSEEDVQAEIRALVEHSYLDMGFDPAYARDLAARDVPPPLQKKENPIWKLIKTLLGFVAGSVVWYLVYMLARLIIAMIAQVPFLGAILYYPSDASWALTVMPPTAAVYAGSLCSVKLSNSSRLFSAAIIILYVCDVIQMFIASSFQWSTLIIALISIGIAAITFSTRREDL